MAGMNSRESTFTALGHTFHLSLPDGQVATLGPAGVHVTLCETLDICLLLAPDTLARTLLEERDVAVYESGVYFQSRCPEFPDEVNCCYFERDEGLTLTDYRAFLLAYLRAAIPLNFPDPEEMLGRLSSPLQDLLRSP